MKALFASYKCGSNEQKFIEGLFTTPIRLSFLHASETVCDPTASIPIMNVLLCSTIVIVSLHLKHANQTLLPN